MTEKKKTNLEDSISNYHKLSIQVSLNGLSFCVLDTINNHILISESDSFDRELTPFETQKRLADLFKTHEIPNYTFSEVVAIHKNPLFSIVPKALFDVAELANYLKFNTKILANDEVAYDEIESYDMMNVYIPFTNINNYIYDLFGEFEYRHHGSVLVQTLLNTHSNSSTPVCYVHVSKQQMDITIISHKRLQFYNSFQFFTKEDFIYHLLFTLEQLKLDTEKIKLRLFGAIEEDDELYSIAYTYIQNVVIFIPSNPSYHFGDLEQGSIDFTVINAL
ncbi:DUF3822 family protein [Spongiimicrobium salis]|uniref:DUF3822 family protein n=1 Tax=Spongiimicrobium salis TaxID=1667022 RepID=UPI00374D790C